MTPKILDEAFNILQSVLINYYPHLIHMTTLPMEIQINNMIDPTQNSSSLLKENIIDSDDNVTYPKSYPKFAIIGTGIRLPGDINNKDDFWKVMTEKKVVTGLIPEDRWDRDEWYSKVEKPGTIQTIHGGFIENAFDFDNKFFSISQNEALDATPEQRWLCELTVETIEDANISIDDFKGSHTGVFVGTSGMDYGSYVFSVPEKITKYTYSGIEPSIHANRVSYLFDLHGPSLSTNTACSSSMTALSIACNSMAAGDCEMAIVAGTNFFQAPANGVAYSQLRVVSKKGACRPFDIGADGYARLEGAAMVLLKPYEKAIRDNNKIYATILSTACNEDGKTASLTTPSSDAQYHLMKRVYEKGHIDPCTIDFIEAHGTGTAVGDPIEARSIGNAYGKVNKANGNPPIPVGSVKGNVGHGEYLSGIVGLIKGALVLHKSTIVPQTAFDILNPKINCEDLGIRIANKIEPLPGQGRHRAAVNSFGFGGANANVILEEEPQFDKNNISVLIKKNKKGEEIPCPYVAFFSASNVRLLKETLSKWLNVSKKELLPMLYLSATTRRVLAHRLFIFVKSPEEFYHTIHQFINDNTIEGSIYKANEKMMYIEATSDRKKGITMAFDEPLSSSIHSLLQNTTFYDSGRDLYLNNAYFADCIDYCDNVLKSLCKRSLLQDYGLFTSEPSDPVKVQNLNQDIRKDPLVMTMFGGMIQLATVALLKYYGIYPNTVIGYGMGEIAAAYAAEKIDLKDAIKILYHYSRVLSGVEHKVFTLNVTCPVGKINQVIFSKLTGAEKECISVFGIPSPKSCIISGELDVLKKIIEIAKTEKIPIEGGFHDAFGLHSKLITEDMKKDLVESLKDITLRSSDISFFSTVKLNKEGNPYNDVLDGQYWWMNMRNPVHYVHVLSQTPATLPTDGKNIIEIGFNFDTPLFNQASSAFYETKRIYNFFTFDKPTESTKNYNITFNMLIRFITKIHGDNVTQNLDYNHLWESYIQVIGGNNTLQQLYSMHYDLPTRCWNHKYLRKLFKAKRNGLPGDVNVGIKTKDLAFLAKLAEKEKNTKLTSVSEASKVESNTILKTSSVPILPSNNQEKEEKTSTDIKPKVLPKAFSTTKIFDSSPFQVNSSSSSSSSFSSSSPSSSSSSSKKVNINPVPIKITASPRVEKLSPPQIFASEDDDFWTYENHKYLVDHKVNHQIVFPAAGSISRALYGYMRSRNQLKEGANHNKITLEHLEFSGLTVFQKRSEDQLKSIGQIPMKLYEDQEHQFVLKDQNNAVISKGHFTENPKELTGFPNLQEVIKSCSTVKGGEGIRKDLIYKRAKDIELQYGPKFQLIQSGRSGRNYSYVKIKVTEEHAKMVCHPAVLDNCFHSIISLGLGSGNRQILPYKIESFEMMNNGHFKPGLITCVSELIYQDLSSVTVNIFVYDEEGTPLVKINQMEYLVRKLKPIRPLEWYNVLKKENVTAASQKTFPVASSYVIIVGDKKQENDVQDHLLPILINMQLVVYFITENHIETIKSMLQNNTLPKDNIAIVDISTIEDPSINNAFTKIQFYVAQGLNFIIGSITSTNTKVNENIEYLFTASNSIHGMLRAARAESRDHNMYCIQSNTVNDFAYALFSGILCQEEPDIIYDPEEGLCVYRLIKEDTVPTLLSRNIISEPKRFGQVNKTIFRKTYGIPELTSHDEDKNYVVVKTKTISLQTNDVLQNSYPELSDLMKNSAVAECVGTIVNVGSNVQNFKKGDFVFGLNFQANDLPSTYVKLHQDLIVPIDEKDNLKQQHLLSSTYAYSLALFLLNDIPSGESILLSTDAGDLMQALVEIAQQKRLQVLIDDTSKKFGKSSHSMFMSLRDRMINTREASECIERIKQLTNGQGVSYLFDLNVKFEKEAVLEKCLRTGGDYIKIGNFDQKVKKRTTHKIIQLSHLKVDILASFVHKAINMINCNEVEVIGLKMYPLSKINNASIEIIGGRLQGKSCLSMEIDEDEESEEDEGYKCLPGRVFREDKSYLVTGAFGGVGLRVSLWMQLRGARHIVLTTSSDPKSKYNHPIVRSLLKKNVHVTIAKCDISKYDEVEKLFKETTPAIDGVYHFANKFGPKLIRDSSLKDFISTFEPKARGALNLHLVSQNGFPLSTFVLFSSVLDLLGNPGQIAYGAANSFLNNIVYYRRALGLPGQCFSLPAMKGSGYLSQWKQDKQYREFSEVIEFLDSEDLQDILDYFLRSDIDPCIQLIKELSINSEYIKHIAPMTNTLKYKLNSKLIQSTMIQQKFPQLKFQKVLENKEEFILKKYVNNDINSSSNSSAGDSSTEDSSIGESSTGYSSINESVDSDKTLNDKENKTKKDYSQIVHNNSNKYISYNHLEDGIYCLKMKNNYMNLEYAEEFGQAITKLTQLKKMQALIIEYEENFSKGLEPSLKEELSKQKPSKSKINEIYKIYFNCLKLANINVPVLCCLNGEITDHALLITLLSQWKIATRRSSFYSRNNPININWMRELSKAKNDTESIKLLKQLETEKISAITAYKLKYINDIAPNVEQIRKIALTYAKNILNANKEVPEISITTEDVVKINNAIKI